MTGNELDGVWSTISDGFSALMSEGLPAILGIVAVMLAVSAAGMLVRRAIGGPGDDA